MTSLAMANLTSSDGTVAKAGLGDEIEIGGTRFGYFIADAAIAQYSACTVQNDLDAEEATTTTSGAKPTLVCIPQFDVADNEYFWAPIGPIMPLTPYNDPATGVPVTFKVLAATLCATSVKLYTTATDGVVDDSATDLIAGLFLTSTNSAGGTVATGCMAVQRMVTNCQD
jgi:hypothetical protein